MPVYRSFSYEIIVVDDCSKDKTVDVVLAQAKTHSAASIRLLQLQQNHGKGGAVRKGVMRARGAQILFADADNATEIRDLAKLEAALESARQQRGGRDGVVVCGSRAHLEEQAIAKRHPLRNLLMHGFHLIVSTLCVKSVRDTQCGFKLFDRTAARVAFTPLHIERWAFDVELLYIATAHKLSIKVRVVGMMGTLVPQILTLGVMVLAGSSGSMERDPGLAAERRVGHAHDAARDRAHPPLLYARHLEARRRRLPTRQEAAVAASQECVGDCGEEEVVGRPQASRRAQSCNDVR